MRKQNNGNFSRCFNKLKKTEQSCQKVDLSFHLFLVLCQNIFIFFIYEYRDYMCKSLNVRIIICVSYLYYCTVVVANKPQLFIKSVP